MNPREQGDVGERAAAAWLLAQGYPVAQPFGHDPDCDLWAEIDMTIYRVQVKTSTYFVKGRWSVALCTRGGNRSWSGIVRRMDESRCDYLFVLVGDGRQWFIPTRLAAGTAMLLGGPKYARFEVESTRPISESHRPRAVRSSIWRAPGGAPELESRARL